MARSCGTHLGITVLVLFLSSGLQARESGLHDRMNQEEAIRFALEHSGLVGAARAGTEALEAKLKQAESAAWPHIRLKSILAPMPRRWSDPDDYTRGGTDLSEWGVFTYTEVSGVQPLYTFGKISNLKAAARLGVDVGKAREDIAREEVVFQVKKAFQILSLAVELDDIVREGRTYFDKARKHVKELEESDDPSFDPVDSLKLRVYDAQVLEKELKAARSRSLARGLVRVAIGLAPETAVDFHVGEVAPVPMPAELNEGTLIEMAMQSRGELVALRRGLKAREAEVRLREAAFYPNFYLAGRFKYGYSSVVEPQSNPFLYDPYNSYSAEGGLVLEWDLDIGRKLGELEESEANLSQLREQARDAENAVRLDVSRLFGEMKDARRMVDAQKDAMEASRGWVIAKTDLYENDLGDLDDVLDALVQFFLSRMSFLEATYEFNVSVARLERVTGTSFPESSTIGSTPVSEQGE